MALHEIGSFKSNVIPNGGLPIIEYFYIDGQIAYVRVFWDDTEDVIVVYKYNSLTDWTNQTNGVIITSGIAEPHNAIHPGEYSNYKFCSGTSLVEFYQVIAFPFFARSTTDNHFSCAQVVCDIQFVGVPIITPAISQDGLGRVQGTATSSAGGVRYAPGPFLYTNGSLIFDFQLYPGTHTIYAQDSVGCITSIQINIPVDTVDKYKLKYWTEYFNQQGEKTRIELLEKAFDGEPSEVLAGGKPFIVKWGQAGDLKNKPIKPSEAVIELISKEDYQFLEFYTNETQYFQVKVKRGGENGPLLWWGFVTPEFYGEPYLQPPYYISLVCNDGLGDLKNIPFAHIINNVTYETYEPYLGRMSHLEVIKECLLKIGSNLPIYTAIDIFEDGMDYLGVPGILKHTFEPSTDTDFPTELFIGVKYLFVLTGNTNLTLTYNDQVIYTPISSGGTDFDNPDFTGGFGAWQQQENGVFSDAWIYLSGPDRIVQGLPPNKSYFLYQEKGFVISQEYKVKVNFYFTTVGAEGMHLNIKGYIGNLVSKTEVFSSADISTSQPIGTEIEFVFNAPINATHFFFAVEASGTTPEGTSHAFTIFIDSIHLEGQAAEPGDVSFEYTPQADNLDLLVDLLAEGTANIKIYEGVKDPLSQIYVDPQNYWLEGKEPMSCFDVLQEQLKPYAARMYQVDGAWHIVRFDIQNAEYARNRYNKDGVFELAEYVDPVFNITSPVISDTDIWIHGSMRLDMQPGFRKQTYVQELGYVENLIPGGNFELTEFTSTGLKNFTFNAAQYTEPIFFEKVAIDNNNNYALSFKNNFSKYDIFKAKDKIAYVIKFLTYASKPSFPGVGVTNTVYIDSSNGSFWLWNGTTYQQSFDDTERLPAGVYDGDFVLVDSPDPAINGYYQVKSDESWIRFIYHYYLLVSANYVLVAGKFYKIDRVLQGSNTLMYISEVPVNDLNINFTQGERYFINSNPLPLKFIIGDRLLIKINKKYTQPSNKGAKLYLGIEVKIGDYYLYDDLIFRGIYNHIEIPLSDEKNFSVLELNAAFKDNITGDLSIKVWVYNHTFTDFINVDVVTGQVMEKEFYMPNLLIDYMYATYLPQGLDPIKVYSETMFNSKKYNEIPEDLQVMHGDAPDVLNNDKIYSYYLTLANGELTDKWTRKGYNESKKLLKLTLESILSNNLNNNQVINGSIRNLITLNNVIYDPNNPERLFMTNYIEWDEMAHEGSVEILEFKAEPPSQVAGFSYGFSIGFNA